MSGYAFHPEAVTDLDEIWNYIAERSPDAADRVISDILAAVRALVQLPHKDTIAPTLPRVLCDSGLCGITWLPMPRTRSPYG